MRTMLIAAIAASFIILWSGCDRCCDDSMETHTYWTLPDSILGLVPYQDGELLQFSTSEGAILPYHVERNIEEYTQTGDSHCDAIYLHSQDDYTDLIPADSGLVMDFRNLSYIDYYQPELTFSLEMWINFNKFIIPNNIQKHLNSPLLLDSIMINDHLYYDVFINMPTDSTTYAENYIPVDSVLYNYEFGILQIDLSDGSWYRIAP